MPESASCRHRRWPAGGPRALLAAIVCVLTVVAAGPGGVELAVRAGVVGRGGPCRPSAGCARSDRCRPTTGHARRSNTPNRSLEPHYRDPATVRGHHFPELFECPDTRGLFAPEAPGGRVC